MRLCFEDPDKAWCALELVHDNTLRQLCLETFRIGVQRYGTVLLRVPSRTLSLGAEASRSLGAVAAVYTARGAWQGLWYRGSCVTEPGRRIRNAWGVVPDALQVGRR